MVRSGSLEGGTEGGICIHANECKKDLQGHEGVGEGGIGPSLIWVLSVWESVGVRRQAPQPAVRSRCARMCG